MRRVVVTGMGVTSPIGTSVAESEQALRTGTHAVRLMDEWDVISDLQGRLGATVPPLDFKALYHRRTRRTMGRVSLLAVHSVEQAVRQAGLAEEHFKSPRTGIAYGSTSGSSTELESFSRKLTIERTMRGLESNSYLRMMSHTAAANVANFLGIRGRVLPTCSACASGSQAVGAGFESVRFGTADIMICGGAEEQHYTSAVTFDLLMATSTKYNQRPDESPRPFDKARDGLVIGEGAGTLVLEELEHAKKRGANVYGEILGYACACDGTHMTSPNTDGMRTVMGLSLESAGLGPDDIDYVNAHATGTPVGDTAESIATLRAFERPIPISSMKSYVGHTLGACGALDAIWTLGMIRDGVIIPNRNLTEPDPNCAPLDYVTELRHTPIRYAMSNNFAFGGINTSIIVGPPPS